MDINFFAPFLVSEMGSAFSGYREPSVWSNSRSAGGGTVVFPGEIPDGALAGFVFAALFAALASS